MLNGIVDPKTLPRYFVLNENTLCYTMEGSNMVGVLGASIIRGGKDWKNGPVHVAPSDVTREATLKDFETFSVCPKYHIA